MKMDFDAIVVDIGTQNCRIGFAGDDYPKALIPSVISFISFFFEVGYKRL
jgi:actin-related protein